jgi:hypothetical protein
MFLRDGREVRITNVTTSQKPTLRHRPRERGYTDEVGSAALLASFEGKPIGFFNY